MTVRTICYYPELVQMTGSINAALMMAQLEFWFKVTSGKPFYKFLEPCNHEFYKVGDSWTEELGMTTSEIRSAFKRIGTMYKSKSAFMEAVESQDIFKGKPYAAYYDRIRKRTFYLRDEDKVREMLPQDIPQECAKRDGSAQQEITTKWDGSAQQEITTEGDGSAYQDTHPATDDIGVYTNQFCVTEESEDGLYREDYRNNNIENSIQESQDNQQEHSQDTSMNQHHTHLSIPYAKIVCLYNDYLGESLGYIRQLTHKDKVSIKKLWDHLNIRLEDFKKGFTKVAASRFLCGKVEGKNWRASLTWLITGEHFIKVLSGAYDDFICPAINNHSKLTGLDKIKQFNQIQSHHFDFDEIERLERLYIDRKLKALSS